MITNFNLFENNSTIFDFIVNVNLHITSLYQVQNYHDAGGDLNIKYKGASLLILATKKRNNWSVIEYLLNSDIDLCQTDEDGYYFLDYLTEYYEKKMHEMDSDRFKKCIKNKKIRDFNL